MTLPVPFSGFQGVKIATIFALDPLLGVPLEPIFISEVPTISPFRTAIDHLESQTDEDRYRVTKRAIQKGADTTNNVFPELGRTTVNGTLISGFPLSLVGLPVPPTFGFRRDLVQLENLRAMARQRRPVMFVSPTKSFARAFLSSIRAVSSAAQGETTVITLDVTEARIVSPLLDTGVLDGEAQAAGKVETMNQGEQPTDGFAGTGTSSGLAGIPPGVNIGP